MADCVSSTEESEAKETESEFEVPSDNITNSHNNVVDDNSSTDLVDTSESASSIGSISHAVDVSDLLLRCGSDSRNRIEGPVKMLKADCAVALLFGNSAALDSSGSNDIQPTNSSVTSDSVPMDGLDKCDTTSPAGCCDTTDDSDHRDKFESSSVGALVSDSSIADGCDKSDSLSLDVETNGGSSGVNTESVSSSTLGQLTKDDSGIDVTPSSSADSPPNDRETSGVAGGIQIQSEAENGRDERAVSSVKAERRMATDDDDDTLAGVTVRNEIAMLMDTDDDDSQQHLDSDADDDDDEAVTDNDKSANSSDDNNDGAMQVDLTPPTDGWCAVREIRRREIGYAAQRVPSSKLFVERTGGSVQLARRLKLQHKLEHHEGCVNCLHFNESGTVGATMVVSTSVRPDSSDFFFGLLSILGPHTKFSFLTCVSA